MDIGETFLLLSVSERQKVIDAFNILKSLGSNATSSDFAGKSGTDLKDSGNLFNSSPEKSLKQKTLDNWIVKRKTPSSNCEKELAKQTCELSGNSVTEEDDEQRKVDESSKLDNVSTSNKKLVVFLNRQNCLESELKSPDHSKLSPEKKSPSPKKIKSPIKKNDHVSENSDQLNHTSEKHSPLPTRSYNLRARGVLDEKTSSGTSHSIATLAKCEDSHEIHKPVHKSVTKQKPKCKTVFEKNPSPNSNRVEVNYDQKTNSCDERTSEEFIKNSECKISPTLVESELEKRSVDSNKITVIDENPTIVELDLTSGIKGKRKKSCKDKNSKSSSAVEKSFNIQESGATEEINLNSKNTQYVQSKKATKLNINENPSELSIEKTVQLPRTLVDTSSFQEQISTNDIVKSVSNLKLKKTTKRKYKNELNEHEKINLDSTVTKNKKKNLPGQEIYSGIITNTGFQSEISDKQLESTKDLEPQIKKYAKKAKNLLTNVTKSVKKINEDSKRTSRKRSCENKSIITTENHSLTDPECITSVDTLSKTFPFQNMELAKETDELLIKEKNTIIPMNAKKMCKKKGSKISANNLISDLEQTSKNNDAVIMTPETLSIDFSKNSSQSKEFVKDSEEFLIKDADTVSQIDVNSKRICRKKSENKSKTAAKTNLLSNSELSTKNNDKNDIISTETSIDSSSNSMSQIKKSVKETEELLKKDTTTVIPLNINSTRTRRKRSNENKSMVATKNSVKSNSEQTSKKNDKDNFETSLIDSSMTKDVFTHQINSSVDEEAVLLNQNNHSSINSPEVSDDHTRKHSKSQDCSSHNEQKTLNEVKELQEDQSKKSSAVSSNMPETNVLHTQEISQLTSVSQNVSTLKKKTLKESPGNSRKKFKSTKDGSQPNTTQSNYNSLSSEMENFGLNLKSGAKKIIASSKIKLGTNSNKEQLDVPISKSVANSSHTIQESKDPCLKNLKLKNKLGKTQKEDKKVKNCKKVKENHSKKKNSLESQTVSNTNLSKHDETTKLNCDLVEDYSKRIKLSKSTSISMVVTNNSENGKDNHIIRNMEEKTDKVTDFTVDNSNDMDIAGTSFKDSSEFHEKMKHNYAAFCKVKEVLGAIGISIGELFENPEMINSLKSISPDGVYFINKCKSDSKFSVHMHESKKELRNILTKLKK